jgi:hypothetical protein
MDALAFRLANRIVGNAEGAAALELTVNGPTLRFATAALIALTGADMQATLDDEAVPGWRPIAVRAGAVLRLGGIAGAGQRGYIAFQGGLTHRRISAASRPSRLVSSAVCRAGAARRRRTATARRNHRPAAHAGRAGQRHSPLRSRLGNRRARGSACGAGFLHAG